MCGSSKRSSERSCEVADGQTALVGQIRESDLAVEVFSQKISRSALLPRRETTAISLSRPKRRSIPLGDMSAKQKAEIIEEEIAEQLRSG